MKTIYHESQLQIESFRNQMLNLKSFLSHVHFLSLF